VQIRFTVIAPTTYFFAGERKTVPLTCCACLPPYWMSQSRNFTARVPPTCSASLMAACSGVATAAHALWLESK
jgi:hypothetical protein